MARMWTFRTPVSTCTITAQEDLEMLNSDPDLLSTGDDISGSGSGMCTDEICHRSPSVNAPATVQPVHYPYPPENKEVKASAIQNLPCITINLLLLLVLLLRR